MRLKKIILLACALFFILSSCQTEKQVEDCLIPEFDLKGKIVESLDELFGNKGKYTTLEISDESLVGKIGKIVKRKNFFFILSEESEILQFSEDGKFVASLKNRGAGPGEYTVISDFMININSEDEIEIWVIDLKTILKYHYADDSWEHFSSIDYPFLISKFHIINENNILLLTGLNDNIISLSDGKGNIISSYLEREIPFMNFKPVQFVNFQTEVVYQKGVSDECVRFSLIDNTFKDSRITCEDKFLSSQMVLDLFSEYEYAYLGKLSGFSYLLTLRQIEDRTLVEYFMNNRRHVAVYTNKVGWRCFIYDNKDIANNIDFEFLSTIGGGDGLTSFIMFRNNENEDKNPIIVEY